MNGNYDEKIRRYYRHWDYVLHFEKENGSVKANVSWDFQLAHCLDKCKLEEFQTLLWQLAKRADLAHRAIFTWLHHDLHSPLCEKVLGQQIADRLDIISFSSVMAERGNILPWQEIHHDLTQFIIETIVENLHEIEGKKNLDQLRQWYGQQLIALAGARQDSWPLEYLREHFDLWKQWSMFLANPKINPKIKLESNNILLNCLFDMASQDPDKAYIHVGRFAKILHDRLRDRDNGMGFSTKVLADLIVWTINISDAVPETENVIRTYLTLEAIGCAILAFGMSAYHDVKMELVRFYVAGGVQPPTNPQQERALELMLWEAHKTEFEAPLAAALPKKKVCAVV
ncbi:MAG: hypothetical protein Q8P32_04785 [Candidatus Komeilibacteria bacterium]|nr:hypothetical protein [Candidatus Komeilibacteria bacterium]